MSTIQGLAAFNAAFENARTIEFNPDWLVGNGSLRPAVQGDLAPELGEGELRTCITKDKRAIILVGTMFGNVIVYQRAVSDVDPFFVALVPEQVKQMFGSLLRTVGLRNEDMIMLVGNTTSKANIGEFIKVVSSMFSFAEQQRSKA